MTEVTEEDTMLPGGFCLLCEETFETQADWKKHVDKCMDENC